MSGLPISCGKMLLDEVYELRAILEHVKALLKEHLLGVIETLPDEIEAVREYEAGKRKG